MRKISLLLLILVSAAFSANAQDLIRKVNGEEIRAKVTEVNENAVRYKLWDNIDGPIYSMRKSKIHSVIYENGFEEFMREYPVSEAFASGEIYPGMKYRDYKKYYNPRDFVPMMYEDAYNPAVAGVCSWLIPGLGQMICGEVGRGFAFFGGCVGSMYLATVGIALSPAEHYDGYAYENRGNKAAAEALLMIGVFGYLTSYIWSIADAPRVAKIKNLYRRDVYDMTSVSFQLEPYFATTCGMTLQGSTPIAAGASLKIRF